MHNGCLAKLPHLVNQPQVKLLREFFVIFLGNSLLVLVAWSIYGARIRNKFMSGLAMSVNPQSRDDQAKQS